MSDTEKPSTVEGTGPGDDGLDRILDLQDEIDRRRGEDLAGASWFLTSLAFGVMTGMMWVLAIGITVIAVSVDVSLWPLAGAVVMVSMFSSLVGVAMFQRHRRELEEVLTLERRLDAIRSESEDVDVPVEGVELSLGKYLSTSLSETRTHLGLGR